MCPLLNVGPARHVDQPFAEIIVEVSKDGAPGEGVDQRRHLLCARGAAGGGEHEVYGKRECRPVMRLELALRPHFTAENAYAVAAHAADEGDEIAARVRV